MFLIIDVIMHGYTDFLHLNQFSSFKMGCRFFKNRNSV